MTAVKRLRVAVITTAHPAGDSRIFFKETASLAGAGHRVTYFAPGPVEALVGVAESVELVSLRRGRARWARPFRWMQVTGHLFRRRQEFDVWHFHDPELLLLCVALKVMVARKVLLVYDAHEDYALAALSKLWVPTWLRSGLSRLTRRIEYLLVGHAALVVGATGPIVSPGKFPAGTATAVVRNYPLGLLFKDRSEEIQERNGPLRLVYLGTLTVGRGVRVMGEAMDLLRDRDVELVLAGEFEPAELQGELMDRRENIKFLGHLPWPDVAGLLRRSDIGICCLQPDPQYLESVPTKVFEYLIAGLPVVTSNFPTWRGFVSEPETGIQVDPTSPKALADAVRVLLEDSRERQAMGRRARALMEDEYCWSSQERVLLRAYRDVLQVGSA